jgi:hypothetical protein
MPILGYQLVSIIANGVNSGGRYSWRDAVDFAKLFLMGHGSTSEKQQAHG